MPFFLTDRAIAHLKIIANAILRHNRWQVQRFTFSPSPLRTIIENVVALLKIYHARGMDTAPSNVTVFPKPVSAIIQKCTDSSFNKRSPLNSSCCRVFDICSRNNHASIAVQVCRLRLYIDTYIDMYICM